MFTPKDKLTADIANLYPDKISELESIFNNTTNVYIDYGNVFRWFSPATWLMDMKRLIKFLKSFSNINEVYLYYGTDKKNQNSLNWINNMKILGYEVITKEVKSFEISIDISKYNPNSTTILEQFIDKILLRQFDQATINILNNKLAELNSRRIFSVTEKKCNFDVEISVDMIMHCRTGKAYNFIL